MSSLKQQQDYDVDVGSSSSAMTSMRTSNAPSTTNGGFRRSRVSGVIKGDEKEEGVVDESNGRRPSQIQVDWSKMAQYYAGLNGSSSESTDSSTTSSTDDSK
mmetsp:Transcript_19388/g.28697  ORF Transcript_19388/g.28697 Transcript_19388/m.28697 type:complete len:102 (-) Transcript_19388:278-583(-)|eukprot:CAMPEP_0194033974 /NCGR_PEP_ID=MMETSP0009_2-20130614/6425_1 /TAXON_ID=210454 /ORGANISM="Grammatophora oceanica, Strain CCMP 410" /LENGTH=101 /DNA_ID=CAMNT_0038674707 /DNA_START=179 /DNA_END=484 /DNA_ORIENTATION=+